MNPTDPESAGSAAGGADPGAGAHVCLGDGQDQRDRAGAALQLAVVSGHGDRLLPDDGAVHVAHRALAARGRDLGDRRPGDVGICDRQFRLVDRDRPCRDVDLGDPALAQARLADVDQSIRRGDDVVRRRLRGAVSAVPHGAAVAFLLADAVSEYDGALAAVAQPAGLGRVRRFDLRHACRSCSGMSG